MRRNTLMMVKVAERVLREMQQLSVRRLTQQESDRVQYEQLEEIPEVASIAWYRRYLAKSHPGLPSSYQTISRHRKTLFANCLEYQTLACEVGWNEPRLTRRQVKLLIEFAYLVKDFGDRRIALARYNAVHLHPSQAEQIA